MIAPVVNIVKNIFQMVIAKEGNMLKNQSEEDKKFFIPDATKEPRYQTWFPFTFFYGGGKIQPIYCFTFLFAILSASMFAIKIAVAYKAFKQGTYTTDMISSTDLATVLAFVSSLILLYNGNKKNQPNTNTPTASSDQVASENKPQEGNSQP